MCRLPLFEAERNELDQNISKLIMIFGNEELPSYFKKNKK